MKDLESNKKDVNIEMEDFNLKDRNSITDLNLTIENDPNKTLTNLDIKHITFNYNRL